MKMENDTRIGLIGWFDILGYEKFLEKSDLDLVIAVIREVQSKVRQSGVERIESILACLPPEKTEERTAAAKVLQETSWLVFADTVVITMAFQQPESFRTSFLRVGMFLELAKNLQVEFLGTGLPLRGAISFGRFYLHEKLSLFAGKPVVEAHRCADAQDWSGCVFTPTAESVLDQTAAQIPADLREVLLGDTIRYPVNFLLRRSEPREAKSVLCLNWPNAIEGFTGQMDLPTFVKRQFERHNKDASSPEVQSKINNTVKFILDSKSRM